MLYYFRKGKILSVFFVCLLCLSIITTGISIKKENDKPTYSDLFYSFEFSKPELKKIQFNDQVFTKISMPGCISLGRGIGSPNIPVKLVKLLIPQGYNVKNIEASGISKKYNNEGFNLNRNPIVPYKKPETINDLDKLYENIVFDNDIYSSDSFYPENICKNQGVGFCRGYSILTVALTPIQYIPSYGEIFYYEKMDLKVELVENNENNCFYRDNIEDRNWVEKLVYNPDVVDGYNDLGFSFDYTGGICDPSDDYDYVIITTEQNGLDHWETNTITPYNWTNLMDKHETDDGLSCNLVTMEEINAESDYWDIDNSLFNDTAAHIREFIRDAYQDWDTDYVLIGGDDEWIPRREMWYSGESPYKAVDSDLYWSNLDFSFNDDGDSYWGESGDMGFDLYSEIFIGSLPCDIPQDISNWMKKSFYYADSYFKDYLENAAFYGGDTSWSCEGDDFIDYSAIKGTDDWLGPNPHNDGPFPSFAGYQFGFETWNANTMGQDFNLSVKWTAESPNPGGWKGGSTSIAVDGLKSDINNDQVTVISAIAHANSDKSMDVYASSWESDYHNTKPFFVHDFGCHCGDIDGSDDGVLHSMLFHSDTELAFGCVYHTGYGWGNLESTNSSSSFQQKSFWDYMFDTLNNSGSTMNWQLGKAQAWSKDFMAPTIDWDPEYQMWRGTIESCLLFADPAQRLKSPEKPDHNIGIQNLDVSSHEPHDTDITIDTTLYNNGKNNETNVYVSFRSNSTEIDHHIISFFEKDTNEQVSFIYHTPSSGWEFLSINITPITGETIFFDNEISKKVIYGPDIAVSDIDAPDILEQGNAEPVKGFVQNLGSFYENNIDIHLIADDTVVETINIALGSGEETWVIFMWDGISSGTGIYDISVYAEPVNGESYVLNQIQSKTVRVGSITTVFTDDFETDKGWTVEDDIYLNSGTWERGIPVGGGNRGDPASDYDGSGFCYLTENEDGDSDVDDGITWLISPSITVDSSLDVKIDYALWYTNDYGDDPNNDLFKVYVSNDDGANWVLAEIIGPQSLDSWEEYSFIVGDYISLTDEISIRFEASDLNSGSVVEAGVDAFKASIFDYTPSGPGLSFSPKIYDFGIMDEGETDTSSFEIWNDGSDILSYSIIESCSWLNVNPTSGDSTGEHDTINIEINTTGLSDGPYLYPISIISNDYNDEFIVDVFISTGEYIEIDMYSGWNLISIPFENNMWASDLSENLTGCTSISCWEPVLQTYDTYIVGGPPSFDFELQDGHGFFVDMTSSDMLILTGIYIVDVSIPLKTGWNLIGWYHETSTSASSIAENITGCTSISCWDPALQTYDTYIVGGPPSFDFEVTCSMGMFVDVSTDSIWHGEG